METPEPAQTPASPKLREYEVVYWWVERNGTWVLFIDGKDKCWRQR